MPTTPDLQKRWTDCQNRISPQENLGTGTADPPTVPLDVYAWSEPAWESESPVRRRHLGSVKRRSLSVVRAKRRGFYWPVSFSSFGPASATGFAGGPDRRRTEYWSGRDHRPTPTT